LSLAEFPNRGPLLEVRNGRELRRVFEQPFVIVYEKGRGLITIYRVFHAARDGQALLDGLTVPESDT